MFSRKVYKYASHFYPMAVDFFLGCNEIYATDELINLAFCELDVFDWCLI